MLSRDHSLLSSSQVFPTPLPFLALVPKPKEPLEIARTGTRNVPELGTDCVFLVNVTHLKWAIFVDNSTGIRRTT